MERIWIGLGALAGLTAVAMAAAAAHAVPGEVQTIMDRAVQMHGWHALALLGCGLWASRGGTLAHLAGIAFAVGTVLFSGSIYVHVFAGVFVPALAPIGGTTLMVGWLLLGVSALRRPA
jgi:uncharacterized membrane protein YgdD (TMEM256/DUF423 family)